MFSVPQPSNKLNIKLPNLKNYLSEFINKQISYPLEAVAYEKGGLLSKLPAVNSDQQGWPWTEETSSRIYDNQVQWPKITIVTPSYNQGNFIEQTIRSVLLQNYPNLEYIVIDGGSTDNTIEILKKYSLWISYWQSEKDNGQSHAINLGFSLASGNYYAWINSDDYYLKDVFHQVITTFLTSKAEFIYGYALNYHIDDQTYKLTEMLPFLDYFSRLPSLAQPSCFWSSAIHQPVWEELQCSLDYELWLRLVKGKSRKLIRKPLAVANVHGEAKTHSLKMKIAWERDHQLICSTEAHGPVYNWNTMFFLYRIYIRLGKLL